MKPRFCFLLILLSTFACSDNEGEQATTDSTYTDLSIATFNKQFLNTGTDTLLLDVRTPEEFDAGHIPGAVHLHVDDPEFSSKAAELVKNRTIVVYCRTGVRSVTASETLSGELGFTKVYNLLGGYTEWAVADTTEN